MHQFTQATENLQQQFAEVLLRGDDRLSVLPNGMAWFDALPLPDLLSGNRMAVAIYPSESLLKAHLFRLKLMGLRHGQQMSAITSDLPPHMERHIWTQAEQQRVPLLLISAKKLQSITTLSQLIRTPRIGPLILEEAQWALPHVWGPQRVSVYENLAILSKHQWEQRPQLLAFAQALSKRQRTSLATRLETSSWPPADPNLSLINHRFEVLPAWSRHQKLKMLLSQLNQTAEGSITLVVAHSVQALQQLQSKLPAQNLLAYHHQMPDEEKELCLMQLLHAQSAVVLVESRLLSEIPTLLLPAQHLKLIYWQLPWTLESLVQQASLATHPQTQSIEVMLFALKDDYEGQQRFLKALSGQSKNENRLMCDHLKRVRHFYQTLDRCRVTQLERVLGIERLSPITCGVCDHCTRAPQTAISSLWMNLISRIRF